jgi:hypothetical protein
MGPPDRTPPRGAAVGAGKAAGTGAGNGKWGTVFGGATDGRTPAACGVLADAIASGFPNGRSLAILSFDHQSKRPLGYAQASSFTKCAFYAETRARVCAKADPSLKLPFDPITKGTWLRSESGDRGPWVFYQSSPEAGGIIVVDDDFGTVFSASIPRKGEGEILAPSAWSTKDLGIGCSPAKNVPAPAQAYDLRSGTRMTAEESRTIAALAQRTVLPGIWERSGGGSEVLLVLLVPRTAGDFDARTAEVLVFLRGWTGGR